jgi:hypothetical protein
VRDADDTLLELGGSYTPTGTWTNLTLVTPSLGAASAASLGVGVAATTAGTIAVHDAGAVTFHDDGNDTNVVVGPVANGTTTLGITGSLNLSGGVEATYSVEIESDSTTTPALMMVDKYDGMGGPRIITYKDRATGRTASPADSTFIWWTGFYNDAATPELIQWAWASASVDDETDGSEDASVSIWNLKDGTGGTNVTLKGLNVGIKDATPDYTLDVGGEICIKELSTDPADPPEGEAVLWMSDGTGAGDDGDILIKITAGGSTKTVTLVDFTPP